MRSLFILAVLLGVAHAQPLPRAEDKAEADRLFEEGRELLAKGERAEACKRFDLSIRKDPRAVGTMLNLGLCREEVGQVATAVRYYAEARDRAHDQKLGEHKAAAERKLALLAPRIPHLVIALPANAARARVLVDDLVIAADQLADVTIDPGSHTIVVTAAGKLPFESKLEIKEGEHRRVDVPPLEGAKTIVVRDPGSGRRTLGKIGVVAGGGLVLTGLGLGYWAQKSYWDLFPPGSRDGVAAMDDAHACWTQNDGTRIVRACNSIGSSKLDSARTLAHVATGAAIVGGLALVTGVILWRTAPRAEQGPAISFDAGPGRGSVTFTRTF